MSTLVTLWPSLTPHEVGHNVFDGIPSRNSRFAVLLTALIAHATMPPNMSETSAAPLQPPLFMKETYFQTPQAVTSPDAPRKNVTSPNARTIFVASRLRRDSKHEPPAEHVMRYDPLIAPTNTSSEESKTLKKRLSMMFCSVWRAIRKCTYSPSLSELDDVNSTTAQLLYADRYQPIYGYGSITAGAARPTIISDNSWSTTESTWSSPQLGRSPRGAQPTPRRNFVV